MDVDSRSQSVTPKTHQRIVEITGELERGKQDRVETDAAREAMQAELDRSRKQQADPEQKLLALQSQMAKVREWGMLPPAPLPVGSPPAQP